MSSGESKRLVSRRDIQVVQNLIERCLQLYMDRKEVVEALLAAKIEPGFTELVWQKLEEENQDFFKAYHLRLMLKRQIIFFNKLLEKQAELMHHMHSSGVESVPSSNGSRVPPLHQNTVCYAPESMHEHSVGAFSNGGSSMHTGIPPSVEISSHVRRIDANPPNMIPTHTSSMRIMQGINGHMIKSEADAAYMDSGPFMYGGDTSFSSVESNSQLLNEPSVPLGQIPRNFSLSDLTAPFSPNDILETYTRSPFLGTVTDTNNLLDSHERELFQGDTKRLDTISEGFEL